MNATSKRTVLVISGVVHVLSLALWAGGALFFSYCAAPIIFHYLRARLPTSPPPGLHGVTPELGRWLAGDLVGWIFPAYFVSQVAVGLLAVASGYVLARHEGRFERIRCWLAAAALAVLVTHAATVYRHSVRVLEQSYEAQAAGDLTRAEQLRKNFGAWHGVSQCLNLATILLVVGALVMVGLTLREFNRPTQP
jgi:hypothetical protein